MSGVERGFLFQDPMILAAREDRKTVTRRFLRPAMVGPVDRFARIGFHVATGRTVWTAIRDGKPAFVMRHSPDKVTDQAFTASVGDLIWARETWRLSGPWRDANADEIKRARAQGMRLQPFLEYRAGSAVPIYPVRWRSARYMPRWVARAFFRIDAVTIHRLQDMTDQDAMAEGVTWIRRPAYRMDGYGIPGTAQEDAFKTPLAAFESYWRELHGPESWAENPWVVAFAFHRVEAPKAETKADAEPHRGSDRDNRAVDL